MPEFVERFYSLAEDLFILIFKSRKIKYSHPQLSSALKFFSEQNNSSSVISGPLVPNHTDL